MEYLLQHKTGATDDRSSTNNQIDCHSDREKDSYYRKSIRILNAKTMFIFGLH